MSCGLTGKGVDINHKDKNGETALMRSAGACGSTSVEMLLGSGVNPLLKNNKGETAYDMAMESAATSRQAACNNAVRILGNPQPYMKERVATKPPVGDTAAQQPSKQSPNIFDALNSLSKTLNQAAR